MRDGDGAKEPYTSRIHTQKSPINTQKALQIRTRIRDGVIAHSSAYLQGFLRMDRALLRVYSGCIGLFCAVAITSVYHDYTMRFEPYEYAAHKAPKMDACICVFICGVWSATSPFLGGDTRIEYANGCAYLRIHMAHKDAPYEYANACANGYAAMSDTWQCRLNGYAAMSGQWIRRNVC